jgi:hypothetical protein
MASQKLSDKNCLVAVLMAVGFYRETCWLFWLHAVLLRPNHIPRILPTVLLL